MKITDKILAPYSIDYTSNNYDVISKTGNKNKQGEDIIKIHGHFSNVENALKKIQKLKVEIDIEYSLKDYLLKMKEVKIEIESKI